MLELNPPCTVEALLARLIALEKMLDEREDRTKERFLSMDRSVSAALAAADKAVNKAESATEKRFEGVNEFRETLRDQAAQLLSRPEFAVLHKSVTDRLETFEEKLSLMENRAVGKKEGLSFAGQIVLGIIAFAAVVTAFLTSFTRLPLH
jgi:hypothetical protein